MEIVLTVVASIFCIVLVEAVAFLTYKVIKLEKELKELSNNTETLAGCTLELSKHVAGVDVIEEDNYSFPNTEGF